MTLEFPETTDSASLIVCPCGELDLYSSEDFAKAVLDRIVPTVRTIVLDFGKITYLDSSGTGTVIRILKKAKASSTSLKLAGLANGPRRVLAMVNLLSVIPEYATVEAACQGDKAK